MGRELYLMLGGMMGLLVRVKMGWWGFGGLMRRTSRLFDPLSQEACTFGHAHIVFMTFLTESKYYSPTSFHQAYDRAIEESSLRSSD